MGKTATIQTRVDPVIKKKAQEVLRRLNVSMSEAISMYLAQIALQRGIPFEIKIPNDLTVQTLEAAEKGEELHGVDSVERLFEDMEM